MNGFEIHVQVQDFSIFKESLLLQEQLFIVHLFVYKYVIHFPKITYFHFARVCKRSFKKAASPEIMLFVNIKSLITVISLILYNKLGGHS